jgi:limonene-1,2-epoxide hydrolase
MSDNTDAFIHHCMESEAHVRDFLDTVWNEGQTDQLMQFLGPTFVDFAMPFTSLQNASGLQVYLNAIRKHIRFNIDINAMASSGSYVFAQLTLYVAPLDSNKGCGQHREVTDLFSIFKIRSERIISHWQVIDPVTIS